MNDLIHSVTSDITTFIKHQQELMFNERDFQMQLAVALRQSGKYDDVDVEYFIPNSVAKRQGYEWDSDLRLDIVVSKYGEFAVVELKYPTKRIVTEITRFNELIKDVEVVKNHGAQDLVSYNFWKDVRRVEVIKAMFPKSVVGGIALMLTNDEHYPRGVRHGTIGEAFSTADGRSDVHGMLAWVNSAATAKDNPDIMVTGNYSIELKSTSIGGHKFYYTIITI